jgi:ADP-ribose pyrophosphatase YjhB (NUDIX family)
MIHGVAVDPLGLPQPDRADWEQRARAMDFEEPPFEAEGKAPAAGAVVVEPDGRLWLVSPTNGFGHYTNTFPKGKAHGMSLKATALKEVFEEAGLQVELFDHLIDVTKTTSRTRYYLARRIGGNPAAVTWEVQAVHLVPLEKAKEMLNQPVDHMVIDRMHEVCGDWAKWCAPRPQRRPENHVTPDAGNMERLDGGDTAMVEAEFERLFGSLSDQPAQAEVGEGSSTPIKKSLGKVGRPISLPGPIGELAKKVGGVGHLAEELGVAPRTIRRWATGGVIPKLPLKMLNQLFKRHAIAPERPDSNPTQE